MYFAIGNADKRGDIAVQAQQGVHLYGCFVFAKTSPTEIEIGTGRWLWSPTHISSGPDRRRSGRAHRADERWRSKPAQSQRRFASRVIRSHRPTSSVPPCHGIPCDRAFRRPTEGTLRCRGDSRGTSTVRTPSRDTDPNRTDSSDSDHRRSGLRTSETLGGEGTRSVERIRCAQNSSSIVTTP